MKYLDEFRDPRLARALLAEIRRATTRPWTIMEICGGQTHSLLRHGIDQELAGLVELVHGPGCPVCVTPMEAVDLARDYCLRPATLLASFGDMLRVPGSRGSLLQARAEGGHVQAVYSPLDALQLARRHPELHVVFFAVGFETTTPTTALAVRQAAALAVENFSLLVAHVRVLPAMQAIAAAADCRVQAFLAAGHVCTVAGSDDYGPFAAQYGMPVVVTGFEPVDLLRGILECVQQLEAGRATVANCYARTAHTAGNTAAQRLVNDVFEVCDRPWRGMGVIRRGGLRLRPEFHGFDAEHRLGRRATAAAEAGPCRSADVLAGRIKPTACPSFGTQCTPENPWGAPMVSSEGACAAYYRYGAPTPPSSQAIQP
jgi:hydrogenase expression/formation protein HypD